MTNYRMLGRASMLALALAAAGAAHAQDTAAPPQAEADSVNGEIVVTALKRSSSIQDIPAAVSAVTGDELQARGLTNIEEITQAIPSVNFGEHTGSTLISIRGVGSTVDSGVTEPTVATYVDGVFMPRSTMGYLRAIDVERVEVLRGPQGTLYGRNATGGAINFISQAPTKDFTGGFNLSGASRGTFGASGFLSGPLSDGISVRISGGHEEDNGFVRLLPDRGRIGNSNIDYVRGAIRFEPSSDLTIDLSARYERLDGAVGYQQLFTPTFLPTPQSTRPNTIYGDAPYGSRVETLVVAGTLNWEVSDDISLKSITSYVDHKSSIDFDADATDVPGLYVIDFARPSESYGQELNLIGETGPLQWILGAYYFHEKSSNTLPLGIGAAFAPGFGVPADSFLVQGVGTKTESFAVFGDLTYSLSDRVRINLGLRYNHEEKDFDQDLFLRFPGGTEAPLAMNVLTGTKSNKLLPKVNLQFDLSDNVKTYAQWSRGFKSGGQNLPGGGAENLGPAGFYQPETINAYEIGLKTQSDDRRITANFAAFYYDYQGLQLTITVPPATTLVQNAPAEVYGVEGEFRFQVSDAFRVDASANWLHARFKAFLAFDDAQPALGVQNLNGRALPHAPDLSANLGAQYRIGLGDGWLSALTVRGDLYYSDRVVLRYFGTDNESQNGYALVNLSATLSDADDKAQLRLFVNNVTNKIYRQNSTYLGAMGAYYGNYAPPRTWGASVSYRF